MRALSQNALTLIELLIAVALIGIMAVGVSSLSTFAQFHLVTADRSAQAQYEASFVLEHMAKQVYRGIGDINNAAVQLSSTNREMRVYIDADGDGIRDPFGDDYTIAYRWVSAQNELQYCDECSDISCSGCTAGWEVISDRITDFNRSWNSNLNYVTVTIESRFDPVVARSISNPQITMQNRIEMPAVSIH